MIRWTGLAPWEFEFPFPGSLTATFLEVTGSDPDATSGATSSHRMYLLTTFRTSTSPQNRQLVAYFFSLKCSVDGFVGKLTFEN